MQIDLGEWKNGRVTIDCDVITIDPEGCRLTNQCSAVRNFDVNILRFTYCYNADTLIFVAIYSPRTETPMTLFLWKNSMIQMMCGAWAYTLRICRHGQSKGVDDCKLDLN